jgi:hypothetical protein
MGFVISLACHPEQRIRGGELTGNEQAASIDTEYIKCHPERSAAKKAERPHLKGAERGACPEAAEGTPTTLRT